FNLISNAMINYINAITLLMMGLMIASKILIETHRLTRSAQLYEEVLESVVAELEEKIKNENSLGA
ncbi:hypothetical protein ACI701_12130, partial [Bacillus velezensis]